MSDLKKEIYSNLDDIADWRIPVLFGALKRYRYYFWTYEQRRVINDEYHKDLEEYNGFPVRYLNIFRKKPDGKVIEINSFFGDIGKQGEYLRHIILNITYNLFHLNEIIKMCSKKIKKTNSFGEEKMVYTDAMVFYKEVENYISEEKKTNSIEKLPYEIDQREVDKKVLIINHNEADKLIKEYSKELWSYKEFYDDEWNLEDFSIFWCGYEIKYKEIKDIELSDKAKVILNNQLTKAKDVDLDTCLELVNSYKLFVEEKNYKRFENRVKNLYLITNTLYEWIPIEKIISILREFYSYSVYLGTKSEFGESERERIRKETDELLSFGYGNSGELCYLIDILSYCYKKGFYFIGPEFIRKVNCLMRKAVPYSKADWYCFDPETYFEWLDKDKMDIKELQTYGWDFELVISNLLFANVNYSASLLVDVIKIAQEVTSYSKATEMIDKAIRDYKKKLKSGVIFY